MIIFDKTVRRWSFLFGHSLHLDVSCIVYIFVVRNM